MTVKELIDILGNFNPDTKVVYKDDVSSWFYEEVTDVVEVVSKLGPNEETENLIELI